MISAELYVSIDVEANGPIPGPHSMWSLGAAAFYEGKMVSTFEVVLEDLEGSSGDPETLQWWATQPAEVYQAARRNPVDPAKAMREFATWVKATAQQYKVPPVCVAYPAGFDFLFVYWYLIRFGAGSPFGFSCLDIKSHAMAKLGTPFRKTTKKNMPKRWFEGLPPHEHVALADAIEQGFLFQNILNDPTV